MRTMITQFAGSLVCFGLTLGYCFNAAAADEEASIFPDKNLEAAVRQYVFEKRGTDKPITEKDVANISTIQAKHKDIQDLTGLEKCRSLASLDLAGNKISIIKPIENLSRLQYLNLADNRIAELDPLATDHGLQYIELSRNQVTDLKPLTGLTNLSSLYLSGNQISEIAPIIHLPRLSSLYLDGNRLSSIAGLQELKTLWTLSLSNNTIEDLSPIEGLSGMYYLFLENNKISDLAPLVAMGKKDTEQRFIPYLNIYLKGNPLSAQASEKQYGALKEMGARMHR